VCVCAKYIGFLIIEFLMMGEYSKSDEKVFTI
jgi:hypothetical protein